MNHVQTFRQSSRQYPNTCMCRITELWNPVVAPMVSWLTPKMIGPALILNTSIKMWWSAIPSSQWHSAIHRLTTIYAQPFCAHTPHMHKHTSAIKLGWQLRYNTTPSPISSSSASIYNSRSPRFVSLSHTTQTPQTEPRIIDHSNNDRRRMAHDIDPLLRYPNHPPLCAHLLWHSPLPALRIPRFVCLLSPLRHRFVYVFRCRMRNDTVALAEASVMDGSGSKWRGEDIADGGTWPAFEWSNNSTLLHSSNRFVALQS